MVIRDPNFWRRFSIAVHQDDLAREQVTQRPEMKHSYVSSFPPPSPSPSPTATSATSQTHLSCSLPDPIPVPPPRRPRRARSKLHKTPSTKALLPPTIHKLQDYHRVSFPAAALTGPHLDPPPRNYSLSLSGRPPSRFRYWTTITADAAPRDSWLDGQRRKARQRTWICWLCWGVVMGLVAGVVVAILVLRGRGII